MRYDAVLLAGLVVLGLYTESGLLTFVSVVALLLLIVLRGSQRATTQAEESRVRAHTVGTSGGYRTSRTYGGRDAYMAIATEIQPLTSVGTLGSPGATPLIPDPVPPMGFTCRGRTRELVLCADRVIVRDERGQETSVGFDRIRGITFTRLHGSAGMHEAAPLLGPIFRVGDRSNPASAGGVLRIDLGDVSTTGFSIAAMMNGERDDPLAIAFDAEGADLFQQAGNWLLARTAPRVPAFGR